MSEWRLARGWTEEERAERLAALESAPLSFDDVLDFAAPPPDGWRTAGSEALIAEEPPGPPLAGGAYARARDAVELYAFSDPHIVCATFDPTRPLRGRRMLLELQVLGLRYLGGTIVTDVLDARTDTHQRFGFRYDTLEGHIERGAEWFVLSKELATGEIRFSIRSLWRIGDMPNWWSWIGFEVLAPIYRRRWLRHAHERLRFAAQEPQGGLLHAGT